jgi:hypothetical protein
MQSPTTRLATSPRGRLDVLVICARRRGQEANLGLGRQAFPSSISRGLARARLSVHRYANGFGTCVPKTRPVLEGSEQRRLGRKRGVGTVRNLERLVVCLNNLEWRRGWDSNSVRPSRFCKLQIRQCQHCHGCQRCRGALHLIAPDWSATSRPRPLFRSPSINLTGPDSGCASVERVHQFVNRIAEAPADIVRTHLDPAQTGSHVRAYVRWQRVELLATASNRICSALK